MPAQALAIWAQAFNSGTLEGVCDLNASREEEGRLSAIEEVSSQRKILWLVEPSLVASATGRTFES
jgi:hypothetical protein